MRIRFLAKDLERAIRAVNRAISGKLSNPILGGIGMETLDNAVRFTATNYELLIRCTVEGEIIEPGRVLVGGKLLYELISKMPDRDIELSTTEKNMLRVQSGKASYDITTMNIAEYPDVEPAKTEKTIRLKAADIAAIYRKVAFAAEESALSSTVFSGVHIMAKDGVLTAAATNKNRLSRLTCPFETEVDAEIIVAPKVLAEVAILTEPEDDLEMAFSGSKIVFQTASLYLESRVLTGQYPDVNRVIPGQDSLISHLTIKRDDLFKAIERLSLVGMIRMKDCVLNDVKMDVAKDTLRISAASQEKGMAVEELPIKLEGSDMSICFNGSQLVDYLRTVDSEHITFHLSGFNRVAAVTSDDESSLIYVVAPVVRAMPVREAG